MSGFGIEITNRVSGVNGLGGGFEKLSDMQSRLEKSEGLQSGELGEEKSFGNVLKNLVDDVKQTHANADQAAKELVAGRSKDIHGAMIAMEKADVSLRMLMQVRNKVIDAYREVMRMQV